MRRCRRIGLLVGVAVFLSAVASAAHAGNEDQSASTQDGPIRAQRKYAVVGELGWNGLVGFGPIFVYHLNPGIAVEGGFGISGIGLKTGVRVRKTFLPNKWSPIAGIGFIHGSGTMGEEVEIGTAPAAPRNLRLRPGSADGFRRARKFSSSRAHWE